MTQKYRSISIAFIIISAALIGPLMIVQSSSAQSEPQDEPGQIVRVQQSNGDPYQVGELTSAPDNVTTGETVQVEIQVEAVVPESTDNIVYAAVGTGEGEVYGIERMPGLGSGSVTVEASIPTDAQGDLYWTWVPAISDTQAQDRAETSLLGEQIGDPVISDGKVRDEFGTVGQQQNNVTVTLEPGNQTVAQGGTTTYDVVIEGATNGISSYDITVEVGEVAVGEISGFEETNTAGTGSTNISDDGSEITVDRALLSEPFDPADQVVIGTLTIQAVGDGGENTEISVGDNPVIGDNDSVEYRIGSVGTSTFSISEEQADPTFSLGETSLSPGESGQITLSGETLFDGLESFTTTISLRDSSVASIENVSVTGSSDPTVEISDGTVTVEAAPSRDTESIDLMEITVVGETVGATDVEIDNITATALDGDEYGVRDRTPGSVTVQSAGDAVSVGLTSAEADVSTGGNTTVDIVAQGATNGIAAYDLTIAVANVQIIEIVEFEDANTGGSGNSNVADNGSDVSFNRALFGDTLAPAKNITLGTLTIQAVGDSGDQTSVDVATAEITDQDNNQYSSTGLGSVALSLVSVPEIDLTDDGDAATDTDGDGLLDDVNGDGNLDIFDVQALFDSRDTINSEGIAEFFDFDESGDDEVNIFDVQALFQLQQQD